MTNDERERLNAAVTASVREDIGRAAPERKDELSRIWKKYEPEVRILDQRSGFTMDGGPYRKIYISLKDARLIWLAAFVSWRAVEAFAGFIFEHIATGTTVDLSAAGLKSHELRSFFGYISLLAKMMDIREAESLISVEWPKDVPEPQEGLRRESLPESERACLDLAQMAEAWAFLHELRHVMYFVDGDGPTSRQQEETACDRFAVEFMLHEIPAYGDQTGEDPQAVTRKRAMALALGMSLPVLIATPEHWGETEAHPAVRDRMAQLLSVTDLPGLDGFWIYASALVLARLHAEGKLAGCIDAKDAKELLVALLVML